jgi:4,5-dihydroxyphthalate decarboxylase
MAKLRLTFACGPFDRTQALRDGTIRPLVYLSLQPAEIFWRMLQFNEFHISEMSLANYAMLVAQGNAPSRHFHLASSATVISSSIQQRTSELRRI